MDALVPGPLRSRRQVLGLVMGGLLSACALPDANRPAAIVAGATGAAVGAPVVDVGWVQARLTDPALRLVDLSPWRRYLAGHLPGAVHCWWQDTIEINNPVYGMLVGPPRRAALVGRLGIDPESTVVVYDDEGGRWAARLLWLLEFTGHQRVVLLDGGVHAWVAAGLSTSTLVPAVRSASYEERLRPELIVNAAEVRALVSDGAVIDTRDDAERHETFNGRLALGRIPGATDVAWPSLLTAPGGLLRPAAELRRLFGPTVLAAPRVAVSGLFGAGAALPYVVLRALGRPVALYDGSWMDWARTSQP